MVFENFDKIMYQARSSLLCFKPPTPFSSLLHRNHLLRSSPLCSTASSGQELRSRPATTGNRLLQPRIKSKLFFLLLLRRDSRVSSEQNHLPASGFLSSSSISPPLCFNPTTTKLHLCSNLKPLVPSPPLRSIFLSSSRIPAPPRTAIEDTKLRLSSSSLLSAEASPSSTRRKLLSKRRRKPRRNRLLYRRKSHQRGRSNCETRDPDSNPETRPSDPRVSVPSNRMVTRHKPEPNQFLV